MKPNLSEMRLSARAIALQSILTDTLITNINGEVLDIEEGIEDILRLLLNVRKSKSGMYIIGNGGSAGVASHAAIDFVNVVKLRAIPLHEPSLLTCMANDYGYENAFQRLVETMAKPEDILVAISSSGNSLNIRNAVSQMKTIGGKVITLTGFKSDNPLRKLGDMNIYLNSNDYGFVEIGHQFVLHNLSDRFGAGYGE